MVEYARMTDDEIIHASEGMLRIRLDVAQTEIERLNEKDKLCTPAEHERMIKQRVIKALSDRMETAERVISTTAADCNKRLRILEQPPKDLSDSYPKDGPRVVEQKRWDVLSEWLKKLDKRLVQVEKGPPLHATIHPYWKNICDEMLKRLELLEKELEIDCGTSQQMALLEDLFPRVHTLEERLTALSETVAKNRKAETGHHADGVSTYNALRTQVIALECKTPSEPGRDGDNRELMALERRVNGLDCERRRQAEKLEVLRETMTSGSLSVTSDGIRFYTERRVEQRRCNQGDRRHTSIQQRLAGRRGDDDRRQP